MKTKQKIILLPAIIFLSMATALFADTEVNTSDGVNKKEAIIIAREYVVKIGMDTHLDISKAKVKKKGNNYWVIFKPGKHLILLKPFRHKKNRPYVVYVNKKTGEIELSYYR